MIFTADIDSSADREYERFLHRVICVLNLHVALIEAQFKSQRLNSDEKSALITTSLHSIHKVTYTHINCFWASIEHQRTP